MSSPPATATIDMRRGTSAVTPETLSRDAHLLLESCGIERSRCWVSRIVRAYLRSTVRGLPFGQYLAARLQLSAEQRAELYAHSEYRYVLSYADPTGEAAVRHVLAGAPQ